MHPSEFFERERRKLEPIYARIDAAAQERERATLLNAPADAGVEIKRLWPNPLDLEALSEEEPKPPQFIIADWIPSGYATLFSGHGGVGKSGIALHLAICVSLGRSFFGVPTQKRSVLYMSCEDRKGVLHWRMSKICEYEGINIADLKGCFEILDLVGCDTVLWKPKATWDEGPNFTPAFAEMQWRFRQTERQLLFVDGVSDTFGGNENSKVDVKQYVNLLLSVIPPDDGGLILIGHVNRATASSDGGTTEGYSGTTGWNNSVRARWYIYPERERNEDGPPQKTGITTLELQKSNLGESEHAIKFKWSAEYGLFIGEHQQQETHVQRKERSANEREGVIRALEGSILAGVRCPSATSGPRTSYHVLSIRPEFPESLTGGSKPLKARFNRIILELMQEKIVTTELVRTPGRKTSETLVFVGK